MTWGWVNDAWIFIFEGNIPFKNNKSTIVSHATHPLVDLQNIYNDVRLKSYQSSYKMKWAEVIKIYDIPLYHCKSFFLGVDNGEISLTAVIFLFIASSTLNNSRSLAVKRDAQWFFNAALVRIASPNARSQPTHWCRSAAGLRREREPWAKNRWSTCLNRRSSARERMREQE